MYSVHLGVEAQVQLDALPAGALNAFFELRVVLETGPWSGAPVLPENPRGAMRGHAFARVGIAVYVVLEEQRRVEVVKVIWAG